jgi:hypothetical protein
MNETNISQSEFLKEKEEAFMDELISQYNQLNDRITCVLERINLRKSKSKD